MCTCVSTRVTCDPWWSPSSTPLTFPIFRWITLETSDRPLSKSVWGLYRSTLYEGIINTLCGDIDRHCLQCLHITYHIKIIFVLRPSFSFTIHVDIILFKPKYWHTIIYYKILSRLLILLYFRNFSIFGTFFTFSTVSWYE